MMPWLLVGMDDPDDDPTKVIAALCNEASWQRVDGNWLLTVRSDDPERTAHRDRQRRYRARKRDAGRDVRDASQASRVTPVDNGFSAAFGGEDHSPPALEGQEVVSDTPNGDAVTRDARDAVTGDARDAWSTGPALTDEQRQASRDAIEKIKAQRFKK